MKFKNTLLVVGMLFAVNGFSQKKTKIERDSIKKIQKRNYQKSIFSLIHKSWQANTPISNISLFPVITPMGRRKITLREGEGMLSDFSLLEANLNLKFPLFFGRKDAGSRLHRLNKFTFDYITNFRMTLDDSKPLTTPSNKVGFSWHLNLHNSHSRWFWNSKKSDDYLYDVSKDFKFWNLTSTIHHYSNGQSGDAITYEDTINKTGETRNNYLDGDFSTNYFYFELTRGIYSKNTFALKQFSIGYRHDWELGETLSFNPAQTKAYGEKRVLFTFDYRSSYLKKFKYHLRSEFTYILGNLENFRANLKNDTNTYRLSSKFIFEFTPQNHRSVGYFASAYYGRDYLNIRYDDIIFSLQCGITLSLDKYFAPKIETNN